MTTRVPRRRRSGMLGRSLFAALALVAVLPGAAAAHGESPVYRSPLPLAVYLAGAAVTVALSFAFVLVRDLRSTPAAEGRIMRVPLAVRLVLRGIGLLAWAWIMVQGLLGGTSDAAVAGLFLWVYGWVGVAIISALLFPVWEWLDPFSTLHDLLAWPLRRLGVRGWRPAALPPAVRHWPAAAGLSFFVWLELVAVPGTQELAVVLGGYTVLTLALMAQFGRDRWRADGETFSVWFRTLNRLAPLGVARRGSASVAWDAVRGTAEIDPTVVVRRPFASGLLYSPWTSGLIVLVAFGAASIIFDGLSQTVAFASVFGAPPVVPKTLLLGAWLGGVALASLWVARSVSPGAIGAGLLPVAVGYLVAHYLTFLVVDGQRIVVAVSDPLQDGSDLLGMATFEPSAGWLPAGLVWAVQVVAVVGGHVLGAWAGHAAAQRDLAVPVPNGRNGDTHGRNGDGNGRNGDPRDLRHRRIHDAEPLPNRGIRSREVPLAVVMVLLTTVALWSLGQAIVKEESHEGAAPAGLIRTG